MSQPQPERLTAGAVGDVFGDVFGPTSKEEFDALLKAPHTCPIVARVAQYLHAATWWADEEERAAYRTLHVGRPGVAGSRSAWLVPARTYLCVDYAVRVLAPIALEADGRADDADSLRKAGRVVDYFSAAAALAKAQAVAADLPRPELAVDRAIEAAKSAVARYELDAADATCRTADLAAADRGPLRAALLALLTELCAMQR